MFYAASPWICGLRPASSHIYKGAHAMLPKDIFKVNNHLPSLS